jgi:hypothetical protein
MPQTQIGPIQIFQPSVGDTAPDSVTIAGNFLFVAYANNVASDGTGPGTSEIVQYDLSGNIVHTYDIAGSVDGLKFDPFTEKLWALQNQDGNSTLTIIDPETHHVSKPIDPAVTSGTRGFDDVVFQDGQVFLSYTNPSAPTDAVIVSLEGGNHPGGELETNPILTAGATGTNTVTHAKETVPLNDPDSLKAAPNGDLLLSSGDDGTIVDVHHAGKADQSVSFTEITDSAGNRVKGLDDVIKTNATSGTFYLTDTSGNKVETFHVTGLNPNDYYASVSSLGGFGSVDPATGKFTLLVAAPGAHGIAFTPDAEHVGPIKTFDVSKGDVAPDSVTIAGDYLFVAYANNVASDGTGPGTSEIVQYGLSGHIVHTYDIAGSVDGLKFDPVTEKIWALQNQDGNSTLTIIDPVTHHVSKPLAPEVTSATRGFDDVVFQDGKVFLSYTNPVNNGDAVIVSLDNGNHPTGELETDPILKFGATGTNTVTHAKEVVPLNDPDSLKTAPNGDLLLSSGDDGTIVDVHHAGKADQSVSFTHISDGKGGFASGLDDVIKTNATSGTFFLTNTSGNSVESFHITGLNPNDYYASVSSLGGFGSVDPHTGKFTLLVQAAGAHGIAFTPDENVLSGDHSHPNGGDLMGHDQHGPDPAALHMHDGHWFV